MSITVYIISNPSEANLIITDGPEVAAVAREHGFDVRALELDRGMPTICNIGLVFDDEQQG